MILKAVGRIEQGKYGEGHSPSSWDHDYLVPDQKIWITILR
jgi:hypothetical protein